MSKNSCLNGFLALVLLFSLFVERAIAQEAEQEIAHPSKEELVQSKYFFCATCHGWAGEGIPAKSAPSLIGLDAAYIEKQLLDFVSGDRGGNPGDRYGGEMALIAKAYAPDDLTALAILISTFDTEPSLVQMSSTNVARGKYLYSRCVSCHGNKAEGLMEVRAPRLAGLRADYLARQLINYRDGMRGYSNDDHDGLAMAQTVRTLLTGPSDIAAIAAYIETIETNDVRH